MSEPLGIFGGTFDPIHFGHLRLAEEAREHLGLAGVRWIPAGQPPHRAAPRVTAQHRLDMVRLATGDNSAFSVDAAEVEAAQPSYTVLTLERLRRIARRGRQAAGEQGASLDSDGQVRGGADDDGLPGMRRPLVLLVGADAFAGLPSWHRWRDLFALAHIAVSHRPGFPVEPGSLPPALAAEFERRRLDDAVALRQAPAGGIITFAMTQLAISATQVRQLLANGRSPRYLLPAAVLDYINLHQLYRNT